MKEKLIPKSLGLHQIKFVYANEADLLNMALFGITAKDWRDLNPKIAISQMTSLLNAKGFKK